MPFLIWEILINLGEPALLFFMLYKKLNVRKHCMPFAILGIAGLAGITTLLNIVGAEYLPTVLTLFTAFIVYAISFFNGSIARKIIWPSIMIFIIIISNLLDTEMFFLITASKATLEPTFIRIISTSVYLILDALFVLLAVHIDDKKRELPIYLVISVVALCILGCISLYFTMDNAIVFMDNHLNIIKISIVAVITIIFILAILLLLDAVSRTLKKVEDAKIEIATINAETEHNKKIFSMVETFREIKHDYVAHLLTISAFANDNDIEGIKAYLSDLNSEYGIEDAFITTNNRVFDSILTAKALICKQKGIKLEITALVPQQMPFSDVELASVFNNLLDNAIEAQETVRGEKYIFVDFKMKGEMINIDVINSSSGQYNISNGKIMTSKADAKVHGLGLKRVEKIVKSHDGTIMITPNPDTFEVYILVPMFS